MASEYETVEDLVKELRGIKGGQHTNGGLSFEHWRARCQFADDYAEAAARLRKFDITLIAQKAKSAAEGYAHGREEVANLRRRLKVAEDALRKLQERLVASVYNGTIDPHEALKIAEDAIAAIREEGGAK